MLCPFGSNILFFADTLLINATIMDETGHIKPSYALGILNGVIAWQGSMSLLPADYRQKVTTVEDCHHQLVTPGLIDCHTHLVYAGHRANEFKWRLDGMSYTEIAKQGGGILSTVAQTRAVSQEELLQQSLPRMLALKAEGVTTVEIKSGYGLDLMNERKMLRVARRLGELTGIRVCTTFLGAHAVPVEYTHQKQAYIDYLCHEVLPILFDEGLVDAVDIFCESIGFSTDEAHQLFTKACALGLPVKCHAEQLSNMGATKLATQFKALSCDHLEFLSEVDADCMAKANTVAVLLPGAYYFLRETQKPPIELLRKAGVQIAIASDCNPGSSPTTSLMLMMNMACQLFSLTVPEVIRGVTSNAAMALGLSHQIGRLDVGMAADLVCWSVNDSAQLCYTFGYPQAHRTMINGQWSI